MEYFKKYRWYIVGIVFLIAIVLFFYSRSGGPKGPPPDVTTFQSGNFSFTYPRIYKANEYSSGVVAVGGQQGSMFIPLIDVVRYEPDPQAPAPPSFDAFVNSQATALCGSDASTVSVSCSAPTVTKYTTSGGLAGEQLSLTLNEKNLKTGAKTSTSYGPIYVFNTSPATIAGQPATYQAVFVYPDFTSFLLVGTTSPEFVQSIADTITIQK